MLKKILYMLGVMLLMAFSGTQAAEYNAAFVAMVKADAERGDVLAQGALGSCYYFGNCEGIPQDYSKARIWYEKAAAQGRAKAQFNLGIMYAKGEGVPQDYAKAREWWEKAAAQGYADAQLNLGFMYHEGHGVRQDYVKAQKWYEKAATQGVAKAQFNLGVMYYKGQGVPQNKRTAKEWVGKACDNGYQRGCDRYRELEEAGI